MNNAAVKSQASPQTSAFGQFFEKTVSNFTIIARSEDVVAGVVHSSTAKLQVNEIYITNQLKVSIWRGGGMGERSALESRSNF